MGKLNARTHRKFERAAGMKFQAIHHKGNWGNWAECADENGVVWGVNKKTGIVNRDDTTTYRDGCFYLR